MTAPQAGVRPNAATPDDRFDCGARCADTQYASDYDARPGL